ncbi:uncharacterized protein LOC135686037 isoform X1 [Rhopilema esculentum]|uniref:uncharacterized protein LOC135686037 isoform X1 n=1 Tax=Rhopilema esculentum TaxID=499914 RepID=UPI0031E4726D
MAVSAKSRNILGKILPAGKGDSKKDGKKKGKRRELTLEALSVSQNFDPESYVIPLQNKWTLDDESIRASDASNNDERHLLSNVSNNDDLIIKSIHAKAKKRNTAPGKIVTAQIIENPSTDDISLPRRVSRKKSLKPKKESISARKSDHSSLLKNLDGIDGVGYVPSHPKLKQRSSEVGLKVTNGYEETQNSALTSFQDTWTVQLQHNGDPPEPNANGPVSYNDEEHPDIERMSSIPGMVEKDFDEEEFSDLDIDRVELVAESDEYEYDNFDDRWSVGTPSLPPLSLSSSEESIDRGFDQSSQSDFSTLAFQRSRIPVQNSTVVEAEENGFDTDLQSKVISLQKYYQVLAEAVESQRKLLLRKSDVTDRKERHLKKQRNNETRMIEQRFTRLESHVVTLARSVAHLSAELKSQNAIRNQVATLQKDMYDVKSRRTNELQYLQERVRLVETDKLSQKTIRKLRRFFGEDPGHPLLYNFLKELGYEEYSKLFQKAKIGIMELPYTSDEQLKGAGIPAGPRKRILENIKHLY